MKSVINMKKKNFENLEEVQSALAEEGYSLTDWGTYLASGGSMIESTDIYGISYGYTIEEEVSCEECEEEGGFIFILDEEHKEDAEDWLRYEFVFTNEETLKKGLLEMEAYRRGFHDGQESIVGETKSPFLYEVIDELGWEDLPAEIKITSTEDGFIVHANGTNYTVNNADEFRVVLKTLAEENIFCEETSKEIKSKIKALPCVF